MKADALVGTGAMSQAVRNKARGGATAARGVYALIATDGLMRGIGPGGWPYAFMSWDLFGPGVAGDGVRWVVVMCEVVIAVMLVRRIWVSACMWGLVTATGLAGIWSAWLAVPEMVVMAPGGSLWPWGVSGVMPCLGAMTTMMCVVLWAVIPQRSGM
jgi:hypothetical protein